MASFWYSNLIDEKHLTQNEFPTLLELVHIPSSTSDMPNIELEYIAQYTV